MNELSDPSIFAGLLQRFFIQRLMQHKNVSPQTVSAYRDTFRLLIGYLERCMQRRPESIALNDLDAKAVLNFLSYLETERGNSIRSRNARLAALRSFMHFVAMQAPAALPIAQQVLAIPMKRFEKPVLDILSRAEIHALLAAPDQRTWFGRRDRVLLSVLYNTGARVSELTNIRVADVSFDGSPSVKLHGKGRKLRTLPLWKDTAAQVRTWIAEESLQAEHFLLPNRQHRQMTRCNVCERLALAVSIASANCPSLLNRRITPHAIRHYSDSRIMPSVSAGPACSNDIIICESA